MRKNNVLKRGGGQSYNLEGIRVLLCDGGDRQTLPMAKAFHKLKCEVATLNGSRLDNGFTSRYVDKRILDRNICGDVKARSVRIKELIETGGYDVVVSTSDETAEQLSLMKEAISEKAHIAVVGPDLFYNAYDKNRTMQICMEHNLPCPKTYFDISKFEDLPIEQLTYPLVIKPRKSFGAIGYHKVSDEDELRAFCGRIEGETENYVFQEYIPQSDIQYECAMFIDRDNEVKTACVFSKNRWFPVDGGSSTCNVTVDRPDIADNCKKLLQTIGWRGPADIDLIQDPRDGIAKILEINPRVSGSVKVVLEAGVNIARQILELAMGMPVTGYMEYKKDVRLRCFHTDLLWFIKSPKRFHSKPSWFSWRHTHDQIWSIADPLPFFAFSVQALGKYRREMKKRSG